MKGMFADVRGIFSGSFSVHEGNHEARINQYARTKAPAFSSLECLTVANLLDYQRFEITERSAIHKLAPNTGWVTTHGDVGRRSSLYSGGVAIGHAKRWGASVICGHTHKLGIINYSVGVNATKTLTGVETGHMMDIKKASYVTDGAPNWQSGWAAVEVAGGRVHVSLVSVTPNGVITFHD